MKNASRFSLLGWLAFFGILVIPSSVFAQSPAATPAVDLNGLRVQFLTGSGTTLLDVIWRLVLLVLQLAGILAFLFVLYGGFLYLTAGGDSAQVNKAKSTIINAIIGIFVITTSYVLVRFVISQAGSLNQPATNTPVVFNSSAPTAVITSTPVAQNAGNAAPTHFAGNAAPTQFAGATPRVTAQSAAPSATFLRSASPAVVQSNAPAVVAQFSPSPVLVQSPGLFNDQACPSPGAGQVSVGRPLPLSCPSPVIVQSPAPIALRQLPDMCRVIPLICSAGFQPIPDYAGSARAPRPAGSPTPVIRQSPAPVVRRQLPGWFYYAWSQLPYYYTEDGDRPSE